MSKIFTSPRARKVRVLATLGPASSTPEMIERLFAAGADAFRVNMSHGDQASKVAVIEAIRGLEKRLGRPTTILADLQGPKLRVGKFAGGRAMLETGATFILDRDKAAGDEHRIELPHREIFEAIEVGARLLLDDGKLVLRVTAHDDDRVTTRVEVGGALSNNKGLNVPDVVVPMAALTEKDRSDLAFALDQHVDWIALSFVQRPEDLAEARKLLLSIDPLAALAEYDAERLDALRDLTHSDSDALANLWRSIAAASVEVEEQLKRPKPPEAVEAQYFVLIECADEAEQVALLERLGREGLTCRALLS